MRKLGIILASYLLAVGCSFGSGPESVNPAATRASQPASCDAAISAMETLLEDTVLPWLFENEPQLIFDDSEDAYDRFIEALPDNIKGQMISGTVDGLSACGETRWNAYLDS